MSKGKRKNRSGSDSGSTGGQHKGKQRKHGGSDGKPEDSVVVSEVLNQAKSVLYGETIENEKLESSRNHSTNSVFYETETDPTQNAQHPIPSMSKMAESGTSSHKRNDDELGGKIDMLIDVVKEVKSSQEGLRKMFESKLDKFKTELVQNIDNKVQALRNELVLDLGKETARIDNVLTSIQTIQARLDNIEINRPPDGSDLINGGGIPTYEQPGRRDQRWDPLSDPHVTVTASGIPVTESENLVEKAMTIIRVLGEDVSSNVRVTAAKRLPSRLIDKPSILKFSLQSMDEKRLVLRNKWKLKDSTDFKEVFIKSSKSHVERLIELNARAVLQSLPQGHSLRVDANGRIKQREQAPRHTQHQGERQDRQ